MAGEQETANAEISSVSIEIEDHGILTAWINLRWSAMGAGLGGYGYDYSKRDGDKCERIYSPKLAEFVRRTMEAVGVHRWEDMKGKNCRVKFTGSGGRVEAIGHIIEDRWVDVPELHRDTEGPER